MKKIKKFASTVVLFSAAILLFSCNLEDFNLNKLADPNDILPDVYAPLAYGTFKVEDFVLAPPNDNSPIPPGGLTLDPVFIDKTGTILSSSAIDSVYLITHFTNNTPADINFDLIFFDQNTGVQLGGPFSSGKIPAGAKDFRCNIIELGPVDQTNLQNSTDIQMNFTLYQPVTAPPITYGDVKGSSFSLNLAFHAPVQLWKLK